MAHGYRPKSVIASTFSISIGMIRPARCLGPSNTTIRSQTVRPTSWITSPLGEYEMVAIDWAFAGTGAIGEEIALIVAATLLFFEVEMGEAAGLNRIVFDGYLEGLHETAREGDPRMVRLGYAVGSALRYGLSLEACPV